MIMDAFLDMNALKEAHLSPSVAYQHTGVALALRPGTTGITGFGDLPKGTRVAVQVGSLAQTILGRQGLAAIPFGFEDDMIEAVLTGEVAAAAVTPASIGWHNHEHPDRQVAVVHAYEQEPALAWDLVVGMRRFDHAFLREVNGAVQAIVDDGTVARIYTAYGIEHRAPPPR